MKRHVGVRVLRVGTCLEAFLLAWGWCATSAAQGPCDNRWLPGDGIQGVDDAVDAICAIDFDGDAPAPLEVFVGGTFQVAGGVQALNVARWDGTAWRTMGLGVNGRVRALAPFDPDGDGPRPPALVAGGEFTAVDGMAMSRIALWDGVSWQAMGTGVAGGTATVLALASYDPDGPGPAMPELVAGGRFSSAGGTLVSNIARWNGEQWSPLGTGTNNNVEALEVFQPDGAPFPILVAGGRFSSAGGTSVSRLASWNGAVWSRLGDGVNSTVFALESFKPFNGPPALLVGGQFTTAGGVTARGVALWSGVAWSALGDGLGSAVLSIKAGDPDGPGPAPEAIFAAGTFAEQMGQPSLRNAAMWDGASWRQLGGSTGSAVNALEFVGADGGLLAGGRFQLAEGTPVHGLAIWNGFAWSAFGSGTNAQVISAAPFDPDGDGPVPVQLVVGGEFTSIGPTRAGGIAIGNGLDWQEVGGGVNGVVRAVQPWDPDGPGPKREVLVIGGDFTSAGGQPFDDIVTWDGTSFGAEHLDGFNYSGVFDLLTLDLDGSGPEGASLIAAGAFELLLPGSQFYTRHLAYWSKGRWLPFSTGEMTGYPLCMTAHDFDGDGPDHPRLVIGGDFADINFIPHNRVAYWGGSAWQSLGSGLGTSSPEFVLALASFDPDRGGPLPARLVAAGNFVTDGSGNPLRYVGQWDGTAWVPLAAGADNPVLGLLPFRLDEADPMRLLAVGRFQSMGGVNASGVAAWDGLAWANFGDGLVLAGPGGTSATPVGTLVFKHSGQSRSRVIVVGDQSRAGGQISASISQWGQDDAHWAAPVSGTFSQTSAWRCGAPPLALERAMFDVSNARGTQAAYTASLAGGLTPTVVRSVDVVSDQVTLDLGASELHVTGDSATFGRDAGLVIGGAEGGLGGETPALLRVVGQSNGAAELRTFGLRVGSRGSASLELNGCRLEVTGASVVGGVGSTGEMLVGPGAVARIDGSLVLSENAVAVGAIDVVGPGAELRLVRENGHVDLGLRGVARLTVGGAGGATGVVSSEARLGTVSMGTVGGALADVLLDGTGAQWATSQRSLFIGRAGEAMLVVRAGAAMHSDTSDAAVIGGFSTGSGAVMVSGAGSLWAEASSIIEIGPGGSLRVEGGGTVEAPGILVLSGASGGVLEGDGIVRLAAPEAPVSRLGAGAVLNTGTIRPGLPAAAGALTIDGGLFLSRQDSGVVTSGVVEIDADSALGVDRLDVTGRAELAGTLRMVTAAGFDPPAGSRFTVLTAAGGLSGRFDVATFPGLSGRFFRVEYIGGGERTPARVDIVVEAQTNGGFQSSTFPSPGKPSDALLTDVNDDTLPDLLLAVPDAAQPESQPGQVVVLLNAGVGGSGWNGFVSSQVTLVTGRFPAGLAAGRFRGGSAPVDLAVTCAADNQVRVHRSAGGGTPSFPTVALFPSGGLRPVSVRAGDLDDDGDTDLALVNYGDINPPPDVQLPDRGNARTLTNDGAGVMTLGSALATGWYPRDLALVDFSGDGLLDLVTADSGTSTISAFEAVGAGAGQPQYRPPSQQPTPPRPVNVEPGGLDNPKEINDVAVGALGLPGGGGGSIAVFLNDGGALGRPPGLGPPAILPLPGAAGGLALLDLDDDTDTDVVVLVSSGASGEALPRVVRNDSGSSVGGGGSGGGLVLALDPNPVSNAGATLLLGADVDADGRDDLVLIGSGATPFGVRADDGAGRAEADPIIAVARSTPPCAGDLDGDARVSGSDLAVLLRAFGRGAGSSEEARRADFNADGAVNTADLVFFLGRFGQTCP